MKENDQLINKYLAYTRVSSKDQALGLSLDEQKVQIQKYASSRNIEIPEDGWFGGVESAFTPGREEFNEVINTMKKLNYKGIIFHKADRSGRNPSDQGKLYDLMLKGYEFHFVTENISTKEHTGRQTLYFMWAVASGYSENLQIEVKKGIGALLRLGRYPNPAPIGYLDKGKGIKELDPQLAPLVKKTFELYGSGHYDIAKLYKEMVARGLTNKRGEKLNIQTMYKLLRNKFYYGCIEYNAQTYVGSHDKIIDKKLFDDVQFILNEKSFKHHRKFWYYFQHMINCPKCGKPLRCMSAKQRYKYYSCRDLTCKSNIKQEFIDESFVKALKELEFSDTETNAFLKAVEVFRHDLKQSKETEIKHLDMELAKIRQETERLLDAYLKQQITEDDFRLTKQKLVSKELEQSERRIALEKADSKTIDQIAEIGKLLKKPSLAYRMASEEKKVLLVKSLVENFTWSGEKVIPVWKNQYKVIAERPRVEFGSATGN